MFVFYVVPGYMWCIQGFLSGDGPLSDIDIDDVSYSLTETNFFNFHCNNTSVVC